MLVNPHRGAGRRFLQRGGRQRVSPNKSPAPTASAGPRRASAGTYSVLSAPRRLPRPSSRRSARGTR